MPKMDGMTVLDKIRKDDWGKNVPVIILTNKDAGEGIIQKVVENQPSYYFIKSNIELSVIAEKIKELLNKQTYSKQ
jgi:DNA-binding NarL/FixJ family response regulator